jgi:hypothetical protein
MIQLMESWDGCKWQERKYCGVRQYCLRGHKGERTSIGTIPEQGQLERRSRVRVPPNAGRLNQTKPNSQSKSASFFPTTFLVVLGLASLVAGIELNDNTPRPCLPLFRPTHLLWPIGKPAPASCLVSDIVLVLGLIFDSQSTS